MRLKKNIAVLVLFTLSVVLESSFIYPPGSQQEYLLKAAFLYRFSDYVDWENSNEASIFTIAVLGESDIVAPLIEISKDKRVKNKQIVIRVIDNANELSPCQIVFISRKYKYSVGNVMSKIGNRPVLVVTEQSTDFEKGSQINFLVSDNKLKFEVNLRTASLSGLKISSQLLQHALTIRR